VSDLNILVLLDSLAAPTLVKAAPLMLQWIRQGNTPPHMYSMEEWSGVQDTFAIELADMNDAREVLWGTDPVTVESVTYNSLRLQTEREIRDTLLQLRLRLMVNANSPSEIGNLLLSGFPSFTAYMRSALRLAGETPGLATRPVIERTAALIDTDPSPFLLCADSRRTLQHIELPLNDSLTERYLGFIRALLKFVDELPVESAGGPGQGAYPAPDSRVKVTR
jgi:hypothetical protein